MAGEMHRLDDIEILASLGEQPRRELERRCRWRRYGANEQILDKDSEDRDIYFVVRGAVQIVNYSMSGREVAFARLGPGSYFGELSAIDGHPRSASVVALQDSLLASVPPQTFVELVIRNPDMAMYVLRRLAAIVRACDERIMDLSTLGAVQRVYLELLRLADAHPDSAGRYPISEMPTHKAIASRAGTTRETVARSISQLTSDGVLERTADGLAIRRKERLQQLAGALETLIQGDISR